jgi:hypothetical protein
LPVELGDARRIDAVALEVATHAERRDDRYALARQGLDRRATQVIVVIVRQQHHIERGQLVEPNGDGMKALGTRKAHGRRALAKHGIGEHPAPLELEQCRAVAEPGDPKTAGSPRLPGGTRIFDR